MLEVWGKSPNTRISNPFVLVFLLLTRKTWEITNYATDLTLISSLPFFFLSSLRMDSNISVHSFPCTSSQEFDFGQFDRSLILILLWFLGQTLVILLMSFSFQPWIYFIVLSSVHFMRQVIEFWLFQRWVSVYRISYFVYWICCVHFCLLNKEDKINLLLFFLIVLFLFLLFLYF